MSVVGCFRAIWTTSWWRIAYFFQSWTKSGSHTYLILDHVIPIEVYPPMNDGGFTTHVCLFA